ncbi:hypothetical protein TRFO_33835 [Tritrichomonas foetus]|uniref:Uncharacterized protein n=1 Tax=Tritrichomonas foetus TaxID=1144522 RepID=A0A1J4JQB2_9EUKA|nr:hypothetical protein TRFO_33835 [Tritrichomonas foetus]|eukprot:OHS99707.1 hypothetical protein TRFO_33835 [Tritrichomonas foetus]
MFFLFSICTWLLTEKGYFTQELNASEDIYINFPQDTHAYIFFDRFEYSSILINNKTSTTASNETFVMYVHAETIVFHGNKDSNSQIKVAAYIIPADLCDSYNFFALGPKSMNIELTPTLYNNIKVCGFSPFFNENRMASVSVKFGHTTGNATLYSSQNNFTEAIKSVEGLENSASLNIKNSFFVQYQYQNSPDELLFKRGPFHLKGDFPACTSGSTIKCDPSGCTPYDSWVSTMDSKCNKSLWEDMKGFWIAVIVFVIVCTALVAFLYIKHLLCFKKELPDGEMSYTKLLRSEEEA